MNDKDEIDRLRRGSCPEVCHLLGMKVRKSRQAAGLSQAAFADLAGIPLRTYKRFESHGKANLETFVAALRALERTQYLVTLFPADARMPVSPTLEETLRITRARRLRPS